MNNFYNTDMQPATMYNNQSSWGQMTQEQFMQYSQIANMISGGLR